MDPVELSITIARPREEVFEYLADIANHPEFTDHYLKEWRLTRVDSYGRGAGARFRIDAPLNRFGWGDLTFVEVERAAQDRRRRPRRQVQPHQDLASWTLEPAPAAARASSSCSRPSRRCRPTDRRVLRHPRLVQAQVGKALRRLRSILEDNEERGTRATVAGI